MQNESNSLITFDTQLKTALSARITQFSHSSITCTSNVHSFNFIQFPLRFNKFCKPRRRKHDCERWVKQREKKEKHSLKFHASKEPRS